MKAVLISTLFICFTAHANEMCNQLFPRALNEVTPKVIAPQAVATLAKLQKITNAEIAELESLQREHFLNPTIKESYDSQPEKRKLLYYIYRSAYFVDSFKNGEHQNMQDFVFAQLNDLLFSKLITDLNFSDANGLKVREKALKVINFYLNAPRVPVYAQTLPYLLRLIEKLNHESSNRLMLRISESILELIKENFHNAPGFKLAALQNLVTQSINKMLGRDYKKTIIVSYTQNAYFFLSTEPIRDKQEPLRQEFILGEFLSGYFIHAPATLGANYIRLSSTVNAEVSFTKTKAKPMTEVNRERFATADMWKDGMLVGAIIIGQDLSGAADLAAEYKAYYKKAGFSFKPDYVQENFGEVFKNMVESGKLDYFLKEDLGGGNIDNRPVVIEGTRRTAKGAEQVYIIFVNEQTDTNRTSISDSKVAKVINNATSSALVYVNTTCYSRSCFVNLVSEVQRKNFTYIAPQNAAETFANEKAAPIMHILNGIRFGQTYEQVKENIEKNRVVDRYTEASDNDYILPNSPQYLDLPEINTHDVTLQYRLVDRYKRAVKIEDL